MPDKYYLKKVFKLRMGKELNLRNPQTFNDKLNWLKLHDRNPVYTVMADKYLAREYVKFRLSSEGAHLLDKLHFIPLLGVWDSAEDVDFDSLPEQFVLKCNHDNGVIICTDKSKLDINATRRELQNRLDRNYYKKCREWPYKNVKRKVICEQFMQDKNQPVLSDYKFFCFNGKVKCVLVVTGRFKDLREDYFDSDFVHLPIKKGGPNATCEVKPPENFEQMKKIAELLSKNLIHLRVDFYEIFNIIYFGELTFYDGGGFEKIEPEEWEYKMGNWIDISTIK